MTVKVKPLSPRQSVMEKRCSEVRLQKLEKMKPDIMAYNERKKKIAGAISVKEMSYLAERSMEKKFSLMENKEPREIEFRLEKIEGWDVPSRCKGKVVFSKLKNNLHTEDLEKELQHRETCQLYLKPTSQY